VRLLHSVRGRLLLMVMTVVLVAVVAVGWTSRRATRQEFGIMVSRLETEVEGQVGEAASLQADIEQLGAALQKDFRVRGDWEGAGRVFDDSARLLDGRTALIVADSRIVASSDVTLEKASASVSADGRVEITDLERPLTDRADAKDVVAEAQSVAFRGPSYTIRNGQGRDVGVLYLMPAILAEAGPHLVDALRGDDFLGSVDRWILAAVVVAGLLALATTVVLSGRIVRPIEELTDASRRMGHGDLAHRVSVRGSDEIGELARAFNSMAASLERNEALRRNMVSDVAHELRTPLTNLRGQLEAVQDGLSQPTPALVASLHEETMLLNHLVDDLQELALAEAGQLRLKLESVDVGGEIERVAELFEGRGGGGAEDATRAAIIVDVEDGLPPAHGDLQRFRQVLGNLLDNAMEHGGGEIVVTARRVVRLPDAVVSRPAAVSPPAAVPSPGAVSPIAAVPSPAASTKGGYIAVTVADSRTSRSR